MFISTQIKKSIESNNSKLLNINWNNKKLDYSFSNSMLDLGNNQKIQKIFYDSFSWSLKENQNINFWFSWANSIDLKVVNWNLYYEVFDSADVVYDSWIVNNSSKNITITWTWKLILDNLAWYTSYNISISSPNLIVFPYNYYQILQNIWWNYLLKEFWKIK